MKRTALLLVALALLSCEKIKFEETTIQGKVINLTNNQPLVGYEVHLIETETPKEPFSQLIVKTIASTISGSDGSFFFEADPRVRDRYQYNVQFDPRDGHFATHRWQNGDYPFVNREMKIEKGRTSEVILGQVPFGHIHLAVENLADNSIDAMCILQNNLFSSQSYNLTINANDMRSNSVPSSFMAGEIDMVWVIHDGERSDSVIVPFLIEHNSVVNYTYTYSP